LINFAEIISIITNILQDFVRVGSLDTVLNLLTEGIKKQSLHIMTKQSFFGPSMSKENFKQIMLASC
jgi:hypothetical protein